MSGEPGDQKFTDLLRQIDTEREERYNQRFADINQRLDRQFHDLNKGIEQVALASLALSNERDVRYEQRFLAQEQAVRIALDAVTREFHEHLLQVERETRAAFDSSEKAILKAENAAEKRFEAVNEFRAQLSAQARDLMPRLETEQRMEAISKEVDTLTERVNTNQGRITEENRRQANFGIVPAIVFGAVGTLLGIVGLIYALAK